MLQTNYVGQCSRNPRIVDNNMYSIRNKCSGQTTFRMLSGIKEELSGRFCFDLHRKKAKDRKEK